jgi:hypothetical protein
LQPIRNSDCPGENAVRENRRLTVRKVAEKDRISIGSCYIIIPEDLGMHWASSKFVPSLLTGDQKVHRFSICKNLLQRGNDDENILKNV